MGAGEGSRSVKPNPLHALYCELTGLELRWVEFTHGYVWWAWERQFGAADLRLVVKHLKRLYRDRPYVLAACLRFRHLIVNVDYFAEYLAEARSRPGGLSGRESVLAATHREVRQERPERLAADVVRVNLEKLRRSVQ